jgi:hypothetical protein
MHVKENYVIFIHLFDSGILLIIDLNKKKGKKGGGEFYLRNIIIVHWRIEKRRLFFEFNVPEYHTAEIVPDEKVYIKVPF